MQLIVGLTLVLAACSRKETHVEPAPELEIIFGRETGIDVIGNTPFNRQDSIDFEHIKGLDQLVVDIYERNLKEKPNFDIQTSLMSFSITTTQDAEYFITRDNCRFRGGGAGWGLWSIWGEIIFPIKITDKIVKNNDTLELASTLDSDNIKLFYESRYSDLTGVDSLIITKK